MSMILDIGCGGRKRGDVGIDLFPFKGVDVVGDLSISLPFRDSIFDKY